MQHRGCLSLFQLCNGHRDLTRVMAYLRRYNKLGQAALCAISPPPPALRETKTQFHLKYKYIKSQHGLPTSKSIY